MPDCGDEETQRPPIIGVDLIDDHHGVCCVDLLDGPTARVESNGQQLIDGCHRCRLHKRLIEEITRPVRPLVLLLLTTFTRVSQFEEVRRRVRQSYVFRAKHIDQSLPYACLLYTSDAA